MKGFTFIELMMTVAIVAILAAVAVQTYSDFLMKSRWSGHASNLQAFKRKFYTCLSLDFSAGAECAASIGAQYTGGRLCSDTQPGTLCIWADSATPPDRYCFNWHGTRREGEYRFDRGFQVSDPALAWFKCSYDTVPDKYLPF